MWSDNETRVDYLNFGVVANVVAEIIIQSRQQPVSIGISGKWGVGKSSLMKLVEVSLKDQSERNGENYIFLPFNAWLYQGYDDTRYALMEEMANLILKKHADSGNNIKDKANKILQNINWVRAIKTSAVLIASIQSGVPLLGLLGNSNSKPTSSDSSLNNLGLTENFSASHRIQELRSSFESLLEDLNVTLVVFIDDLDRCLPETAISTLEAIRVFLFIKNTAFVIAADNEVTKLALEKHLEISNQTLVTNYFDKLIQVPIRVPKLGLQEVRAYLILLYIEKSSMKDTDKVAIREEICNQLAASWQGKRVDREYINSLSFEIPEEVNRGVDVAEHIAPILTHDLGHDSGGNPRLIKRFLNEISIRQSIASVQSINVDEEILMKMLLLERCGAPQLIEEMFKHISISEQGCYDNLAKWEKEVGENKKLTINDEWNTSFFEAWLKLKPSLAEVDLRRYLYISRSHTSYVSIDRQLSPEGAEILEALLSTPRQAGQLSEKLARLEAIERSLIFDQLLKKANKITEWGAPPILSSLVAVVKHDKNLEDRLLRFLKDLPVKTIKPAIVPALKEFSLAGEVFSHWKNLSDVKTTVKNAIQGIR